MGRVLITTDYLAPDDVIDRMLRDAGHETTHVPGGAGRDEHAARTILEGYDAAIVGNEPITRAMLVAADRLRIIARTGVGYDSIDVAAAEAWNIAVTNAPGTNHHSVAELALGLMLSIARKIPDITAQTRRGAWPREPGHELHGSTLGVIGYGASGRAVASLGTALGMRVLVTTEHPSASMAHAAHVPLDVLLRDSDVVSLHVAASPDGPVITRESLSLMRSSAILINTARGSVVDEEALADALAGGRLAAAGIDVLQQEPPRHDHPLLALPNVFVTSHLAGQTTQARERSAHAATDAVLRCLDGLAVPNVVSKTVGAR